MYRAPLVFSGVSCLVGNLVLCLSYDTKLLPLLYAARLLTGCGAHLCVATLLLHSSQALCIILQHC